MSKKHTTRLHFLSNLIFGILLVTQIACTTSFHFGFQEEHNLLSGEGDGEEDNLRNGSGRVVPVTEIRINEKHQCTTWLESFLGDQTCNELKKQDQNTEYSFNYFFNVVCQEARYTFLEASLKENSDSTLLLHLLLKELSISSLTRSQNKLQHFRKIAEHTKKTEDLVKKIAAAKNAGRGRINYSRLVKTLLTKNYVAPKDIVEACRQSNDDYKKRICNLLQLREFGANVIINEINKSFNPVEKGGLLQTLIDNELIQKSDLTPDDQDALGI